MCLVSVQFLLLVKLRSFFLFIFSCLKIYFSIQTQLCPNQSLSETIYIYIYIYIYSHSQKDLFRSIRTLQDSTTQPRGNERKRGKFKRLCITFVFVYIYPLNGYQELNSYEEPCITLVANLFLSWL